MIRKRLWTGVFAVSAGWIFSGAAERSLYLPPDEPFFFEPSGDVLIDCVSHREVPTAYAPRYTFRGFSKITEKMTMPEVKALLGEPLLRIENVVPQAWWYSYKTKGSRDFHLRLVAFDTNGRVLFTGAGLSLD